uniref:Ripply transcriptional repressor 2 n=2 Tax=Oryctolagus cuniculus TaxID=9986 RepID=A0A5F9DC30_RABIT|nr:protein ripply2 isoform X2 [Oryctolagus cuniculus]
MFFTKAKCRPAINTRWEEHLPGHLGAARVHTRGRARPAGFWRPWQEPRGEEEEQVPPLPAEEVPCGPGMTEDSGKLSQYRHPVRLFWPRSKCYDYLYQEAEALLKNFPIQATISFYEDSDSEDEIEELTCENQSD